MTVSRFCLDIDLLRYEPDLFGTLRLPAQVKAAGAAGVLSGTALSDAGADFESAQVAAGDVVYLAGGAGAIDGPFEITERTSATALGVSILRAEPTDEAIAPPATEEAVTWHIATFAPQIVDVSYALCERFGLSPGDPSTTVTATDLLSVEPLRRAAAMAALSRIYTIWAGRPAGEVWRIKARDYAELYEEACQRCHVALDVGGDGVSEEIRTTGSFRLRRG
jgi:hypothetical protein